MKAKKSAGFWVAIALAICLISSVGASILQSDGGALLLVPETATAETPAPAIVVSHGWYNNREMQDLNYVEYARRGYVVLAISMYGHGDSAVLPDGGYWDDANNANGLYDGVKYVARLPFVDPERIGVTGHSNGALACREAGLQMRTDSSITSSAPGTPLSLPASTMNSSTGWTADPPGSSWTRSPPSPS